MWRFLLLAVMAAMLGQPVRADMSAPVAKEALPRAPEPEDPDLRERRARMHEIRQVLREQQRRAMEERRENANARGEGHAREQGMRLRMGERLRHLPPEERRKLRREMQEAARELYRP